MHVPVSDERLGVSEKQVCVIHTTGLLNKLQEDSLSIIRENTSPRRPFTSTSM